MFTIIRHLHDFRSTSDKTFAKTGIYFQIPVFLWFSSTSASGKADCKKWKNFCKLLFIPVVEDAVGPGPQRLLRANTTWFLLLNLSTVVNMTIHML